MLPDTRWTEERWSQSRNKRLMGKEGGKREKIEERRRLKLRIVVQPRASTISRPCLLFFTLLLCQPALVRHLSLLSFCITHSISQYTQCKANIVASMSMFLHKRASVTSEKSHCQPTHGNYNICIWCLAMNVECAVIQSILLPTSHQTGWEERTESGTPLIHTPVTWANP